MIPTRLEDLDHLRAEIERQHHEVADLFGSVSDEVARWRPEEGRWSMTGHLAHLSLVNGPYLEAMTRAAVEAGERGVRSSGPYKHSWVSRRFVRMMEPPPKRRVKTFRSMNPEPDVDTGTAVEHFDTLQTKLEDLIESARGLDLGRAKFASPFFRLLKLSLGSGFELLLAHNRRHIWLVRELMERADFPG